MLRPIALPLLIGLPLAAWATPPPAEPPSQAAEATPARDARSVTESPAGVDAEQTNVLDTTRYYVHYGVEWLARGIDGWFGDSYPVLYLDWKLETEVNTLPAHDVALLRPFGSGSGVEWGLEA